MSNGKIRHIPIAIYEAIPEGNYAILLSYGDTYQIDYYNAKGKYYANQEVELDEALDNMAMYLCTTCLAKVELTSKGMVKH